MKPFWGARARYAAKCAGRLRSTPAIGMRRVTSGANRESLHDRDNVHCMRPKELALSAGQAGPPGAVAASFRAVIRYPPVLSSSPNWPTPPAPSVSTPRGQPPKAQYALAAGLVLVVLSGGSLGLFSLLVLSLTALLLPSP